MGTKPLQAAVVKSGIRPVGGAKLGQALKWNVRTVPELADFRCQSNLLWLTTALFAEARSCDRDIRAAIGEIEALLDQDGFAIAA